MSQKGARSYHLNSFGISAVADGMKYILIVKFSVAHELHMVLGRLLSVWSLHVKAFLFVMNYPSFATHKRVVFAVGWTSTTNKHANVAANIPCLTMLFYFHDFL